MDVHNFKTFFGELASSDKTQDMITSEYIESLERKIAVLEDIVNTSNLIAETRETMLLNQNQSMHGKCSDVGIQTDLDSVDQTNVVNDGIHDLPQSFVLTSSDGKIELSESLLSINKLYGDWDGNSSEDICYSDVSPVSISETSSILSTDCIKMTEAFELAEGSPFENFSLETLGKELDFTHEFSNRKAVYFGSFDYEYPGGTHRANEIDPNSYMASICSYLGVLFPELEFNSALINFYSNGSDFMPLHSDDENCIEDGSSILTISLGATRTIQFTKSSSGDIIGSKELKHGSVFLMSKDSQSKYAHEIIPDVTVKDPRVSITFRTIKPSSSTAMYDLPKTKQSLETGENGYVPYPDHFINNITGPKLTSGPSPKPDHAKDSDTVSSALYISSSMFRGLNMDKLSSNSLSAQKLFYPGANAEIMLRKLKGDICKVKGTPNLIYIMCGTNNIDKIYYGSGELNDAAQDVKKLLRFIQATYPTAKIHVINILPRLTLGRNEVVYELNKMVYNFCVANDITFMKTDHLFRLRNGKRMNQFFMPANEYTSDNCHLNAIGYTRFGKFVKYWTYRHLK